MHLVLVLVHQQRAIGNGHNVRNLVGRCADDGLQSHFSQQADAAVYLAGRKPGLYTMADLLGDLT